MNKKNTVSVGLEPHLYEELQRRIRQRSVERDAKYTLAAAVREALENDGLLPRKSS